MKKVTGKIWERTAKRLRYEYHYQHGHEGAQSFCKECEELVEFFMGQLFELTDKPADPKYIPKRGRMGLRQFIDDACAGSVERCANSLRVDKLTIYRWLKMNEAEMQIFVRKGITRRLLGQYWIDLNITPRIVEEEKEREVLARTAPKIA